MKMNTFNKILYAVILILFAILLFTKCKCPKETLRIQKDSTSNIQNVVPVYIKTPADSSWLKAYFKCDSLGNVYIAQIYDLKSKNINTDFSFKDGVINYKTNRYADSILIYTINKETTINRSLKSTETIIVKEMSSFQKIFFWIGIILSFLLLIYFGRILKNRIII